LKKSRFTRCATVEDQIKLESDIEVFEWSRNNRNIQSWSNIEGEMSVGGGGYEDDPEKDAKEYGAGLSLSSDLSRGFTEKCLTFNSPRLTTRDTDGVFNITNIEVWTLTPVLCLEDAEKLELSRQVSDYLKLFVVRSNAVQYTHAFLFSSSLITVTFVSSESRNAGYKIVSARSSLITVIFVSSESSYARYNLDNLFVFDNMQVHVFMCGLGQGVGQYGNHQHNSGEANCATHNSQ
jgi:hypothetical protein